MAKLYVLPSWYKTSASQDVYVNTTTMLKGKCQLDPQEVISDSRVASKRIHIERVIGL